MYNLMGFVLTLSWISVLNDISLHNELINVTMLLAPMAYIYFLTLLSLIVQRKLAKPSVTEI